MRACRHVLAALMVATIGACSSFGSDTTPNAVPPDAGDGGSVDASSGDAGDEGGSLVDGAPEARKVLFTTHGPAHSVWADEARVYWTELSKRDVHSVTVDGGDLRTHATDLDAGSPRAIVAAGGIVFWADGSGIDNGLRQAPLAGGPVTRTALGAPATNLTTNGTRVFVTTPTTIDWRRLDGSEPTSRGGYVNLIDVAVRGTDIYWLDANTRSIYTESLQGGGAKTLQQDLNVCRSITVTLSGLVATCAATLRRFGPGDPPSSEPDAFSVAADDDDDIYWLTNVSNKGALRRLPPTSGTAVLVEGGFDLDPNGERERTQSIALTKSYVFWVTRDAIIRRTR